MKDLHWDWEGYIKCRFCFGPWFDRYGIEESVAFWCGHYCARPGQ